MAQTKARAGSLGAEERFVGAVMAHCEPRTARIGLDFGGYPKPRGNCTWVSPDSVSRTGATDGGGTIGKTLRDFGG